MSKEGSRKVTEYSNNDRNAGDVECAAERDDRRYCWSKHIQQFYDIHTK